MKNVILSLVFALVCGTAFAGSCENGSCGVTTSRPVASATVNVGRRVVQAPVRFVRRLRAGVSARRAARLKVRAERTETVASCCSSAGCECEPSKAE